MLVFIDDSGDPGFQINKGSSPVFIIALVIFRDELEAEKTAVALKELRRKLKFPDTVEFKFHKSRIEVKRKFFKCCSEFNFKIRAIVIPKEKIYSNRLKTDNQSFFNYIVMQVLKNNKGTITNAKLRLDSRGERRIRNELRIYLSRALDNKKNKVFKDLKFVNSKQNILIQLADMIAGCVASSYKGKNPELLKILKKQVEDIWEFK